MQGSHAVDTSIQIPLSLAVEMPGECAMLIDDFMSRYDFFERHEIVVPAAKEVVRKAVEEWRPASRSIRTSHFRLSGFPGQAA